MQMSNKRRWSRRSKALSKALFERKEADYVVFNCSRRLKKFGKKLAKKAERETAKKQEAEGLLEFMEPLEWWRNECF